MRIGDIECELVKMFNEADKEYSSHEKIIIFNQMFVMFFLMRSLGEEKK